MEAAAFIPDLGDLYITLAVCAVVIVLMVYLGVRASKQAGADPRRRVLLPMLAYFGGLLALMAFLGALWTTFKYPTVTIAPTTILIGKEEQPLPRLTNVRLEAVGRGVNTGERVLLLQTRDRRNYAFPADRYDIQRMYTLIKAGQ
ncbi:hypothetical protein LEM8419_03068 [Neolewinella maritima]|uniref:PH domain-containing protein n=1 Tax=Neolewinella maritima TaxID=1383882 RepID=A0ABN8FDC8_9BACT|nr:hypothetical protein [Neolewinella maritima]CAH1002151.1 hypothetical protein LEM8419_03068 [Neolewinella maritima]